MDFRAQMAKDVGQTVADALAKCSQPILEPKYDGWRCVIVREADRIGVYNPSRKEIGGKCYTGQLPELEAEFMKLPVGTVLDGELVALTHDVDAGRWTNDFYRIHTVMRSKDVKKVAAQRVGISFIAFDCPMPNLAPEPLAVRRDYVRTLLDMARPENVTLTMQLPATQESHDDLVKLGFEGSMVKDEAKPYGFGKRGHGWFKIKSTRTIDTVVMEVVMDGKGKNTGKAGRMIVGQYLAGELVEVAKVNCLNDKQRDDATADPEGQKGRVLEVKIYGWDKDGPRHPTPLRFRSDKPAIECEYSRT